jgi:enoyl-CoA hydratase/carnithine racemase
MKFESLEYRVEDKVAWITLDRPSQYNAVNSIMSRELPLAWQYFEQDNDAVVAVITGAGESAFCTGADLHDLPETDGEGMTGTLASIRWTSLQNRVWKPVICAVNGMTVGGGLHFVADSDIVIAADHAVFSDTHVKVGLVAGLEPVSLCRRMPMEAVMRLALSGGKERLSASQAKELGLVGEVVPADQLLQRVRETADNIKHHSPAALTRTKKAIWQAQEMGLHQGLENAWNLIMEQGQHPDVDEGIKAFREKRAACWQPYR